jgi:hypothetical protein
MDTSPVSPEDVRAAAEVHEELGPEYRDAVVAAFVDKVEREVDARVRARLAAMHRAEAAPLRGGTLLKGMAIGAGAGALVAFAAMSLGSTHPDAHARPGSGQPPGGTIHVLPYLDRHGIFRATPPWPGPPNHRIVITPPKS